MPLSHPIMLADAAGILGVLLNSSLKPAEAAIAIVVCAWYYEAEANGRANGDFRRITFSGEHGIAKSSALTAKAIGSTVKRLADLGVLERVELCRVKKAKGYDTPVKIRFTAPTFDAAISTLASVTVAKIAY